MHPRFEELRQTIYTTQDELSRFYQLIVNITLATDICDKKFREFRTERFAKAFAQGETANFKAIEFKCNLKATVGMEYLIQACDVAHTMQAWPIYRQWNAKLFAEQYKAYKDGRGDKDPSEGWFQG